MFSSAVVFLAALASIASAAPANLTERAPLGNLYTKCKVAKTIAFTFDDGPYTWNTEIVNLLKTYNAKGTFFVNGANYGCIYSDANVKSLKTAYNAGHQIASHTWAHKDLATLSKTNIQSEMTKLDTALSKILGVKAAHVRPPYGSYNNAVREVAAANGQGVVMWDFDSGDSVGKTAAQSVKMYQDLAKKNPNNVLTLNHETYQSTVKTVLPAALKAFKDKGYKMVTVAECLGVEPYISKKTAGKKDSTWKC